MCWTRHYPRAPVNGCRFARRVSEKLSSHYATKIRKIKRASWRLHGCKASSESRCRHIAAFVFAYILNDFSLNTQITYKYMYIQQQIQTIRSSRKTRPTWTWTCQWVMRFGHTFAHRNPSEPFELSTATASKCHGHDPIRFLDGNIVISLAANVKHWLQRTYVRE